MEAPLAVETVGEGATETTDEDDEVALGATSRPFAKEPGSATEGDNSIRSQMDSPSDRVMDGEELERAIERFQHRRNSLRLSASNVAAMAGLHPYKNLPDLVLRLVYQGTIGEKLMHRDSLSLGVELASEEEVLLKLASKAGPETRKAVEAALLVKDGKKAVVSVDGARKVKEKAVQEATKTGKLVAKELKVLNEGVRSAVDTGYGVQQEDGALDAYEALCGWDVRERNTELRSWSFGLVDDSGGGIPTVAALETSKVVVRDSDSESTENQTRPSLKRQKVDKEDQSFFYIMGSVDGIRDELAPATTRPERSTVEDDDSWVLRQVVVECKHRMRTLHSTPPLYEQVQATVYCFMHGVEQADIVQVMRRAARGEPEGDRNTSEETNGGPPTRERTADADAPNNQKPVIQVSRVSLDDPVMKHRQNWAQVVLPRLRSFVEAVYEIRRRDDKRYRFLVSASDPVGTMEEAWNILHSECPWLLDCDTAYYRDR